MVQQRNMFTQMTTLVKREFIEHRLLFVYTPLLCVLTCTLWFAIALAHNDLTMADPADFTDVVGRDGTVYTAEWRAEGQNMNLQGRFVRTFSSNFDPMIRLALWSSLAFYYLMTLYQQRQDRSILFWNSLPVGDAQTILSKLLAGLVLCHMFYLFGIVALQLLMPAVVWVYSVILGTNAWDPYLGSVFGGQRFFANGHINTGPALLAQMIAQVPIDILWTLPVYGWLLLASAWSPRAPLLWALAPWLFLMAIELAITDQSLLLDTVLAHTFALENFGVIPARIRSQLVPGALLGVVFIYGAIRLMGPSAASRGFE